MVSGAADEIGHAVSGPGAVAVKVVMMTRELVEIVSVKVMTRGMVMSVRNRRRRKR